MRDLARTDVVTGLTNRAGLNSDTVEMLMRLPEHQKLAMFWIDLDRFKEVNDTLGHPVGDRLLCAVADRLRTTVRESDTLARLGGDEFTLVQTRLHEPRGASVLAEKILAALAEPFVLDRQQVRITTSIGIALCPEHGAEPEPLIEHADIALYQAKARGRGRVEVFADAMRADLLARRAVAGGYAVKGPDPR